MLLKELLTILEEQETIDVRNCPEDKQIDHKYWPKGVMYGTVNVFDAVYESDLVDVAQEKITEEYDGNPDRNGVMQDSFIDKDWIQECYLGYDKKRDLFVLGFDASYTEDNPDYDSDDEESDEDETIEGSCSPYVIFTLDQNGKYKIIKTKCNFGDSWYSQGGGYSSVAKKMHLVDIRLD